MLFMFSSYWLQYASLVWKLSVAKQLKLSFKPTGRNTWYILCYLQDDRAAIFKALGKERLKKISAGDLDVIAKRTRGFTGADLQALLYTAQLRRIHRKLPTYPC